MPDQSSQPTILVKKADGTSVRMTMDEFKAYRAGGASTKAASVSKPVEPPKSPSVIAEKQKPVSAPAAVVPPQNTPKPVVVPPSAIAPRKPVKAPKQWNNDDHVSPLEEKTPVAAPVLAPVSTFAPEDRIGNALQQVSFAIKESVRGRLNALLASRVKGIRSNEQVMEYLVRPESNGGVGFTQEEAMEVLAVVNATLPRDRDEVRKMKQMIVEKRDEVAEGVGNRAEGIGTKAKSVTIQPPAPQIRPMDTLRMSMPQTAKPVVQDVTPPAPRVQMPTGPMDEFRMMTVAEFRRLGQASVAAETLTKKVDTIKAESYVMYLDARDAWRESPVFRLYQDRILQSLREKKSLKDLAVSGGEVLTFDEWQGVRKVSGVLQ